MLALLLVAALATSTLATNYCLTDEFIGKDFLVGFEHEAIDDPTHGRVTYVDEATALKQNLTYAHGNTLVLRADHTTVLNSSGPGRDSVRIRSKKTYTTHVAVYV